MRAVLIALMLLLVAPEALGAKQNREVVVVEDYTSAAWDGIVAETVADFNAVIPKHGPRLVYARKAHTPCDAIPKKQGKAQRIIVCSDANTARAGGASLGYARNGIVYLSDHFTGAEWYDQFRENAACHEFMHTLTAILDSYGADPESCVWGARADPGSFDVEYLKQVFARHR